MAKEKVKEFSRVFVLGFLAVIGIGFFLFYKNQQATSITKDSKFFQPNLPTPFPTPSNEWKTYNTGEGYSIMYPVNWYLSATEKGSDGFRNYTIFNTRTENLTNRAEYMQVRFSITKEDFSNRRQDYIEYFNRYPPNSTFLFLGDTPAKFTEETLKIDGHRAIRFIIDEKSREQEQSIEQIIVELDKNKVLGINRFLTEDTPPTDQIPFYDEAYNKIIESITID